MLVSWARVYVWTTISPRKFFGKSKVKKRLSKFFFLQNDSIYFNDYFLLCLKGKAYLPGKNRKEIIKTQIGQSNCLLNGAQTITHLNSLYSCGYLNKMIWSWRWRTSDFFTISLYNRKCCTTRSIFWFARVSVEQTAPTMWYDDWLLINTPDLDTRTHPLYVCSLVQETVLPLEDVIVKKSQKK